MDQALAHPWIQFEGQPVPSSASKKLFGMYRMVIWFCSDCLCAWYGGAGKLRKFTAGPILKRLALLVLARTLPEDSMTKQMVC